MSFRRVFFLVSAVSALVLGPTVGVASAHAVLVGTDPAYGATVDSAPASVTITFDEAVTAVGNTVTVVDRDGSRVDTGEVRAADGGLSAVATLEPNLPDGTYLLSWVVLSADGHTVGGSSVFGIGMPPDLTLGDPPPDPLLAAIDTMVRLLTAIGYLGVVLAVGVPAVAGLVWRVGLLDSAVAQSVRIGAGIVVVVSLLVFAAIPGRLAGADGWVDLQAWKQAVTSWPGSASLIRVGAGVALAVTWPRKRAGFLAAAVIVVTTAVSGHSAAGEDRLLALVSTVAHVAAMAVWTGGLVLAVVVWRRPDRSRLLAAFTRVAVAAVAVLAVTGWYQGWRSVAPVQALWTTQWGLLLLVKVAVVLTVIVSALFVRAAVRRRRSPESVLRIELVLQVAVLVVTALLAGAVPARDSYNPEEAIVAQLGPIRAEAVVDGAGAGKQELTVRLFRADGTPVGASQLDGRLTLPGGNMGPVDVTFRRVDPVELGPSYFVSNALRVPLAGSWQLRLTALLDRTTGYVATVPYRVW